MKLELARLLHKTSTAFTNCDAQENRYKKRQALETSQSKMDKAIAEIQKIKHTWVAMECLFEFRAGNPESGERAGTMCGNEIMVSSWKLHKSKMAIELGIPEHKRDPSWKPSYRCQGCKEALRARQARKAEQPEEPGKSRNQRPRYHSRSRSRSPSRN